MVSTSVLSTTPNYGEREKSGGVIRPTFLEHAGCIGDADYQCVNANSAPCLRGA